MATLRTIHGVPVWMCAADGAAIRGEADVLDLIGDAGYHGARWVALPAERLDEAFFRLRTRFAGDVVQKFANYRLGLAVVGDISRYTAESSALRDNDGGVTTQTLGTNAHLELQRKDQPADPWRTAPTRPPFPGTGPFAMQGAAHNLEEVG
ncbi:DUF4180 domain-containing protein [Streptomyces mobaraensis]|nr:MULTISPECIES: DUF4180 domain-containing protein [Streptomyces]UBI35558.1 DUF4180 domain-containing protein [Streptomyces mobaraensis]UKW28152.1 DUF4180 domain-containing protein [Streptomyces sp. TYQ1024]